jgi:hypothetical protein
VTWFAAKQPPRFFEKSKSKAVARKKTTADLISTMVFVVLLNYSVINKPVPVI